MNILFNFVYLLKIKVIFVLLSRNKRELLQDTVIVFILAWKNFRNI